VKLFLSLLLIGTCALGTATASRAEITLYAASSLHDPLAELVSSYTFKRRNAKIGVTYDSSQTLARKIDSGTTCDIFISAHRQWTDFLKINHKLEELFITTLASNALVFVARPPVQITDVTHIASLKRIALGNPKIVAHGQYTMEALKNAGVFTKIFDRVVWTKSSMETVTMADSGDVDGAIIYNTEVVHLKHAKPLFTIPPSLHTPIIYQVALTKAGARKQEVLEFYKFLNSAPAKAVLAKYGFLVK